MRVRIAVSAVAAIACIAGCSSSHGLSANNGKEVKKSHCDVGATSAMPDMPVQLGKLSGTLQLRESGSCKGIYWAHFLPDNRSEGPWTVLVVVVGKRQYEQPSDHDRPRLEAYTVGAEVRPGEKVQACVQPTNLPKKALAVTCLQLTV